MPHVTTIAPDGATISIPFTGTPLDQIHLAAALDHYTANSLGSLDITRSPDFALNSPVATAAAPAMTVSRPAPVMPATRAADPFVTRPMQNPDPTQNTASAQTPAPLPAQSKTPRRPVPTQSRSAVSQQTTILNPVVNNDPADTIGKFAHATDTARQAYTTAPTPQNEQALRTAYANELTNLDRTGATRTTPQWKQYADAIRDSGWDKPRVSLSKAPAATLTGPLMPAYSRPTPPMMHPAPPSYAPPPTQSLQAASASAPLWRRTIDNTFGTGNHASDTQQMLRGVVPGVKAAFHAADQWSDALGEKLLSITGGTTTVQNITPAQHAANARRLLAQAKQGGGALVPPTVKDIAAGVPAKTIVGNTLREARDHPFNFALNALPFAEWGALSVLGKAAKLEQMAAAAEEAGNAAQAAQMRTYAATLRRGAQPVHDAVTAKPLRQAVGKGVAALRKPPVPPAAANLPQVPLVTPRVSPSLGLRQSYGPAAGQARAVIPDVGSKGGATRPPGGGRGPQPQKTPPTPYKATPSNAADMKLAQQIVPPEWLKLKPVKSPRNAPAIQQTSPILNVATMPGSTQGKFYINVVNAHREVMQRIINPKTGGISVLEQMGIPHKVVTYQGTSTTQAWGKEPNMHIELPGADAKTAKYVASLIGTAFRQDGVGIHYPISSVETRAAAAAIKAKTALPQGLHRVLSVKKVDNSVWTPPEIDAINQATTQYNVELQTTPDGKGIEFHDYGSAFASNPVKAGQDWAQRVAKTTDKAGLRNKDKFTNEASVSKSEYVDKSNYRRHLGTSGRYTRTNPGAHRQAVGALARIHRAAFRHL